MSPARRRVIIIGGGIGGLAAAYRLQRLAFSKGIAMDLTLLEQGKEWGGVLRTTRRDGFLLEGGPDCFISEKPAGLALAREVGLEQEIVGTNSEHRQSFILKGRKLIPVPEGLYLMAPSVFWPFVRSPLVSWPGKFRMGLDLFIPKRTNPEDESLESFVLRRLGREALHRIAQPMLAGIYTADPAVLSLKATMPRFMEMEQNHGSVIRGLRARKAATATRQASGPRYGLFLSFREGMQTLPRRLTEKIGAEHLVSGVSVERIEKEADHWTVATSDGKHRQADWVFVATPISVASRLLRSVAPKASDLLGRVDHASTATLNFAFDRSQIRHTLNGMGFVVPNVENKSLVGCSFSSQKFPHRAPADKALLRVFVGGGMHEPILDRDDDELRQTVFHEIRELLGITGEPLFTHVTRWNKSMPQYAVGHLDRIQEIEAELETHPGLYVIGNGFRGIGVPDVIQRADDLAHKAINTLPA